MKLREIVLLILITFSSIIYISYDNIEPKKHYNYIDIELGDKKLNIPQPISMKMYDEILRYS